MPETKKYLSVKYLKDGVISRDIKEVKNLGEATGLLDVMDSYEYVVLEFHYYHS